MNAFLKILVSSACILLIATGVGCQRADSDAVAVATTQDGATPAGGVAVVDLDEVARRIGRDQQMGRRIEQFREQKNQEVAAAQTLLQQQLKQFQDSLGDSPTPEQQQQLGVVQRKLAGDFTSVAQQASSALNEFKQTVIHEYRDELRPLAREIAARRGLQVVITHQDSFQLVVDPRCDITEELSERLLEVAGRPAAEVDAGSLSQR